jgi:acyl carrier protein
MTRPTFAAISSVLVDKFKVDRALISPTTLEQLGLDSLALMEFVFAVEDRFDVRISKTARQAGVTLEQLAVADRRGGRGPAGAMPQPPRGTPVALTGTGVVSAIGNTLAAFDATLFAATLGGPGPGPRPAGHRAAA